MSVLAVTDLGGGAFVLAGPLTFESVPAALEEAHALFAGGALTLDLSAVTRTDSAGLALLIEWMREAQERGTELHFRNIPPQLVAIARTSGLDRLLPREEPLAGADAGG